MVGGSTYGVYRDGIMGPFVLELNGTEIARAKKSAWSRLFTIEHEGKAYTLKAASAFGRRFVLAGK